MLENPWDNDPIISAAPTSRAPILSRQPPPQTPVQAQGDAIDVDLKQRQLEDLNQKDVDRTRDAAEKQRKFDDAKTEAVHQIRNVTAAARSAQQGSKRWLGTGFGAESAKGWGGTAAADVDADLDTVGANTAFEALQKMRDASPTGGALGQITERELDLLKSTIASLSQAQSDTKFRQSMQKVIDSYERVLFKLPGGHDDAEARLNEMLRRGATLPQVRKFWESTGRPFTAEQDRKIRGVITERRRKTGAGKQQPAGDDVDDILKQYGVQ